MFSNFDVMNHHDWELWSKYSRRTFNTLLIVCGLVWTTAILLKITN